MGGACSAYGGEERGIQERPERDLMGDPGVDGIMDLLEVGCGYLAGSCRDLPLENVRCSCLHVRSLDK